MIELIEPPLRELGSVREAGESFLQPALDVIAYYPRRVRLSWVPFVGRALGLVAVLRQPADIEGTAGGYQRLLTRLAMAANGRFPPWQGVVIGLTAVVLTPEPIAPGDDAVLRQALETKLRKMRVVPFGLVRVNLGQEALALALSASPDDLFPEPVRLGEVLCEHLKRYVAAVPM